MNVLHLRPTLAVGGASEYIIRLSEGLGERGHRVFVLSGGGEWGSRLPSVVEYRDDFRLAPWLTGWHSIPNFVDLVPTAVRLAKLIRREQIQVINTHHRYAALVGRLASALTGTHLISTIHEIRKDQRRLTALGLGERVIVLSQAVKRHVVQSYAVAPERVSVIPMGLQMPAPITATRRATLLAELGIGPEMSLIACVARLHKRKGHLYLFDAMARLAGAHPELRLLLIGDGEERGVLEQRAAELTLGDRVVFMGVRDDVSDLIELCRFTVLPSLQEEFGIVLLESLAHGRPVVASAVGGIPEVITSGEHGILVPPADPAALAGAIEHLVTRPDLASEMGRGGRGMVEERFSMRVFVDQTERTYAEVLTRETAPDAEARRGAAR